jgi:hypothetical protein
MKTKIKLIWEPIYQIETIIEYITVNYSKSRELTENLTIFLNSECLNKLF